MKRACAGIALVVLTGCASSPEKMTASYVSPMQYKDYNCDQIASELARVDRQASELHGRLQKTASNDNAQMAVGMILFWPALFFLEGGDGPEAAEYSRLKGEKQALDSVGVQKQCMVASATTNAPADNNSTLENQTPPNASPPLKQNLTVEERLEELATLKRKGIITAEEYDSSRARILTEM